MSSESITYPPNEYDLQRTPPYRLKWPDVLKIWRDNEENLGHWKEYYRSQGYDSWEDWREKFFRRFGVRHLKWHFYEVRNSVQFISSLRGADSRGWRRLTGGKRHLTFWQMADLKSVQEYEALRGYIDNFPEETTIIAVRHGGSIFVIEGMHRCAGFAVALKRGKMIDAKIRIAIGIRDKPWPFLLGFRI